MPWNINWSPYIEEDFLEYHFSDEDILKAKRAIELALEFPKRLEKMQGFPKEYDIRKMRYRCYRIFLLLNWITENADCLRILLNHKGYEKKHKKRILFAATKISNNS